MKRVPYNRQAAVEYAKKWALLRNPQYLNFQGIGGDCTNFASQCLYAGSGVMNYTKDVGWYYNSPGDRAAAWTSAKNLNRFLTQNKGVGPVAKKVPIEGLELGDLIQLSDGDSIYHTLVVTGFSGATPLICTHTLDSYMRPLDTYRYREAQGLHLLGVNRW